MSLIIDRRSPSSLLTALAGHEAVKGEVMELRTIVENQREEIERKRKELDRLQGVRPSLSPFLSPSLPSLPLPVASIWLLIRLH